MVIDAIKDEFWFFLLLYGGPVGAFVVIQVLSRSAREHLFWTKDFALATMSMSLVSNLAVGVVAAALWPPALPLLKGAPITAAYFCSVMSMIYVPVVLGIELILVAELLAIRKYRQSGVWWWHLASLLCAMCWLGWGIVIPELGRNIAGP